MKKFLVLIWGCVDGITQWNTETIRQQWQFSNMPPASIWQVQISISVIWPLAQKYWFLWICSVVRCLVCFWRKQWSLGCSSVLIEVGLSLDPTFVDFHPSPLCTGSQLALPSLPCQPQGFSETLPRAISLCSQFVLSPECLSKPALCAAPGVSALSQEKQQVGEGKRQNGANPTSVWVERQCNGPGRERENYSWITE